MARWTHPQWSGFEDAPKGRLLGQIVDLNATLGIAYERSVGFVKDSHIHDRHMLVCPRGASVMEVIAGSKRYRVDSRQILWVPKKARHSDEAVTTLYDTLALYPDTRLFHSALTEIGLDPTRFQNSDSTSYLIARRTRLFDDLLEAFFITRIIDNADSDPFQERQLIGEALRSLLKMTKAKTPAARSPTDKSPSSSSTPVAPNDNVAERAIRYIEANLFLPIALDAIAKHAGASTSTLLRAFRSSFKKTPYAYIKQRRLEEAQHLLLAGEHTIGQVALLVGYEDFGAFSKAFRATFGKSPREHIAEHSS